MTVLWVTLVSAALASGWIGVHLVGSALVPSSVPVLSDAAMDAQLATAEPLALPKPKAKPTPTEDPHPDHSKEPSHSSATPQPTHSTATPEPTHSSSTPKPDHSQKKVVRTFRSRGGSAVVSCVGSTISLGTVSPAVGYRIDERKVDGREVEVKFEGDDVESSIKARCESGEPVADIDSE